jgi:hypothetical protein
VGLWRSLGARFHGMEEVVGSIPTRSTNPFSPAGLSYRTNQVLFTAEEVDATRQFANRLELIERGSGTVRQIGSWQRGPARRSS